MKNFFLGVIVPVYNEEQVVRESIKRLTAIIEKIGCPYEILFVNDGSRDSTLTILREEKKKNSHIRILNFTRNFGHQMAITAGMDWVKGDVVITIDADLQDPPELMIPMLEKWEEGYDIVYARRIRRLGETIFKRWTALLFYRLVRKISNVDIPVDVGDYRLMSRRALDSLNALREKHRYVRGLVAWLGYRQAFVDYERDKRFAGQTKYTLLKMIKFSVDGLSSFSVLPLRLATLTGFFSAFLSFVYIIYALYAKFILHDVVRGWTTVIIAIFFLGGMQLIGIGIVGEYVGMIHEQSKNRPLYLIQEIE